MRKPYATHRLSAALGGLGISLALILSGCLANTETVYVVQPAPTMTGPAPDNSKAHWREVYEKNRPEAPRNYQVMPKPPRNNEFAEFDDGNFQGLDTQPDLPALPADAPLGNNLAGQGGPPPPVPFYTGQTNGPRPAASAAPAPLPRDLAPTSLPARAGIETGEHFYPVEQLVYGGDYPDIDKPENYRLMPRDIVTVTVKDHPEFSEQLEIQPDGTVRVPNTHDLIRLRGLTVDEAAEELRRSLAPYIKGPTVVRVQANVAKGGYYFVFGEVMQPGRFPMGIEPVRLSEAVLAANWEANPARRAMDGEELGPAFPAANPRGRFQAPPSADLSRVVLITPHRSQPVRTVHDVRSALLGVTANDPPVRPGQIIVVPPRSANGGQVSDSLQSPPPPALNRERAFGYNSTPATLPEFEPPPARVRPNAPGDSSWIESVPRRPEPETESLIFSPVDTNMAGAFDAQNNSTGALFREGVTVEGPTIIQMGSGERYADPPPPVEPRRKTVRSGGRGGTADGWKKGL